MDVKEARQLVGNLDAAKADLESAMNGIQQATIHAGETRKQINAMCEACSKSLVFLRKMDEQERATPIIAQLDGVHRALSDYAGRLGVGDNVLTTARVAMGKASEMLKVLG